MDESQSITKWIDQSPRERGGEKINPSGSGSRRPACLWGENTLKSFPSFFTKACANHKILLTDIHGLFLGFFWPNGTTAQHRGSQSGMQMAGFGPGCSQDEV